MLGPFTACLAGPNYWTVARDVLSVVCLRSAVGLVRVILRVFRFVWVLRLAEGCQCPSKYVLLCVLKSWRLVPLSTARLGYPVVLAPWSQSVLFVLSSLFLGRGTPWCVSAVLLLSLLYC